MSIVEGLEKKYDGFALAIHRWEIPDEGVSLVWGPSGAGKSTIFRCLIGFEECPGLKWNFKGQDLMAIPVPQRNIGVVFQNYELFPHLSAKENILFPVRARGDEEKSVAANFSEWTEILNLSEILGRKARLLSGGEQQRVALARALMARPKVLFLDEPFSALDEENKEEARGLLARVVQHLRIPAVLISHERRDIDYFGGRVFRLKEGKLTD